MLGGSPGKWLVAIAALALLATTVPAPAAASSGPPAVPLGMDAGSATELAQLGAPPTFASYWVGAWMTQYGWGGLDNALATARSAGVTPLLYWYYWGDNISPACVTNGCAGLSRSQWDAMTQTLVDHVKADMGGAPVTIVLENEFNKNGVDSSSYAPTFDALLQAKAATLHTAPGARVVLGFGGWGEGNWGLFPKAIAASDGVGFQTMRGSTKDSEATYRAAPDRIAQLISAAQGVGAKGAFLYDLALSSYPDAYWAQVQSETLGAILARLPDYASAGLQGISYRSLRDDPSMSPANYYGYAEQHWGLRDSSGAAKPAWSPWSGAYAASAPPAPAPAPAQPLNATFSPSPGNNWWVQTSVNANQPLSGVCASVQGGACQALALQSWGDWAGSFYVPTNATLTFTATAAGGSVTSGAYWWPSAAPVVPVASFTTSASGLSVSADGSSSQDASSYSWSWGDGAASGSGATATHDYAASGTYTITLTVSDGAQSASRTASVNVTKPNSPPRAAFSVSGSMLSWSANATASSDPDGDALTYAWSWGDGATGSGVVASHAYASAGNYTVTLTASDGLATSTATRVVTATAPPPPPPPAAMTASFSPYGGNAWWEQTLVSSNQPLASVCVSINGGACQALKLQSWGAWAASYSAPSGSLVRFTATSTTGQQVISGLYAWPSGAPAMTATFTPYGGNNWWVQTRVNASEPIVSVCASVNGGACQQLTYQSWGAWAASFYVATGARVTFKATGTSGASATSAAYKWPAV